MSDLEQSGMDLLKAVEMIAMSAGEAEAIVSQHHARLRRKYPRASEDDIQDFVAEAIVTRFARLAGGVGGLSGLTAIVPGIGTVIAAVGGGLADAAACMKLQVDMSMCLAANYGYDLTNTDAKHLSFIIAGTGTLEQAGTPVVADLASRAGVKMLRQYLKGGALQTVKAIFRKIGINFTRKALEKALPFGIGVAIGASANFYLTKYVGNKALKWFVIDRATGGPSVTLGTGPEIDE